MQPDSLTLPPYEQLAASAGMSGEDAYLLVTRLLGAQTPTWRPTEDQLLWALRRLTRPVKSRMIANMLEAEFGGNIGNLWAMAATLRNLARRGLVIRHDKVGHRVRWSIAKEETA